MSFIGDFLFGSKGTPSQVVDPTPDPFADLQQPVADLLQGFMGTGGPAFQGDLTAGVTGQESDLLARIGELGGGETALTGQSSDLLSRVLGGDFLGPGSNPFLNDLITSLQERETKNFERVTLPRLQSTFTAAGQRIQPEGSSPFDTAAAMSTGDLLDRLSGISTQISAGNFEAERGRQQEAIGLAGQLTQQNLSQGIQALQASALPRLIEQLGLDKGMEEFRRRIDVILQTLQTAGVLSSPRPVVLPGTSGQGGNLGGVLTGAGALIAASSREVKYDNQPVGPVLEKLDRVPVERWRYTGRTQQHIGPYAEDFQREFGVGDGEQIVLMDALGVALAAIKELTARVKELEKSADWLELEAGRAEEAR